MKRNKTQNKIIGLLYENPNLSRIDLSKKLDINKSTISTNVQKLIDNEFIQETGRGESTPKGGKKPIQLVINYNKQVFLGFDISKDYISYALTNLNLEILNYGSKKIKVNKENVYKSIKDIIESLKKYQLEDTLFSVSIAIHGIVFEDKISLTPNYDLDKSDFLDKLKKDYPNMNIYLINEANAAVLCEHHFHKYDNLASINIRTGLGCGIVINNKLIEGNEGYAGEIGHMIIVPDGKICQCGNKGCFEQYCSENSDISYYNTISKRKIDNIKELVSLYKNNDYAAIETVNRNIYYMSIGINNLTKTIAPEIIYINSYLAYNINDYVKKILDNMNKSFKQNIKLEVSKFSKRATLLGCIYYGINKYLNNKK